ncbi:MAG: NUDIX hydrolase [Anaerolineae bacterium]
MLTLQEKAEIEELAGKLGTPLYATRELVATTANDIQWFYKLVRRRGEVILVVPRPNGRVLLHTKSTYPSGIYRLPGGGVNPGEPALDAAQREALEETGFDAPMTRLLGVVENEILVQGNRLSYPSYVFLTGPTTALPHVLDLEEDIADFREVPVDDLSLIAAQLEAMPPDWQPWGQFRATPHVLARQALVANK